MNFPPITTRTTFQHQMGKVAEESCEAIEAWNGGESDERIAEELYDVIQAAETAIRMLDVNPVEIQDRVYRKNQQRGYYGGNNERTKTMPLLWGRREG